MIAVEQEREVIPIGGFAVMVMRELGVELQRGLKEAQGVRSMSQLCERSASLPAATLS